MKTQTTAIQSELARVRNLKRTLEAEVVQLRSDTESGKLSETSKAPKLREVEGKLRKQIK